jgi:RNA polymerase sigma factor (sigma-70 family)
MDGWKAIAAEVVETRHRSLVGYGILLTSHRQEAEDLVQDALVKVFGRLRAIPNAAAADQYVRHAMRTIYLDGVRRRTVWRRVRGVVATSDAVGDHEDAVAASTDVAAALALLSPRERTCVVLRHYDDLTVPQIAAATRLAEGTVKRYLSDAIAKLGAEFAPDAETTDVVVHRRARRT